MVDGANDKAEGNTASPFTVRHITQELRGWFWFCRGGEGCRRHGRAGHPYVAALFRHAQWTLRQPKLTATSSRIEQRYTDVGLLRAPLQQKGNSGMSTTEDAEAVARACIDANFAGGETTDRQGCRN